MKYYYIHGLLLLMCWHISKSQSITGKILAQNNPDNANCIDLKWYTQQFIHPAGVNIYRKTQEESEWKKLNSAPITIQKELPTKILDKEGQALIEIIKNASQEQLQSGMLLLTLLVKSFQSNEFAQQLGLMYIDSSIERGQNYTYQVRQIINKGEEVLGTSLSFLAQKYTPLPAPKGFKVESGEKQAKIYWQPDEELFYAVNIYRKSLLDKKFTKINERPLMLSEGSTTKDSSVVSYADDSLLQDMVYYYKLVGLDYFGNETLYTTELQVLIKDLTPPPPIENLKIKTNKGIVTLTYSLPKSHDINQIGIYRSNKSDGPYHLLKKINTDHHLYNDTILATTYFYYKVSTIDKAGNETFSQIIFTEVADVWAPKKPEGLIILSDTGKTILKWKANTESDLMGYYIYRCIIPADTNDYVLLNANPKKENNWVDTLPKRAKNQFYYCIVAIDTSFNKSPYSTVVKASMPDIFPPEKPVWKNNILKNDSVQLEWFYNVETDIKEYILKRTSATEIKEWHLSPKTKQYNDIDLNPNTEYHYTLFVVDSSNNSSQPSSIIEIKTSEKPTHGVIKINKADYSLKNKESSIEWEITKKENLLGYMIFKVSSNNIYTPISDLIQKDQISFNTNEKEAENMQLEVRAFLNNGDIIRSKPFKSRIKK